MASNLDARAQKIKSFLEEQNKKHPGVVGVDLCRDLTVVPTGVPVLDRAIGVGGLPLGLMVELFGDEGVGKSSLAMIIAASFQQQGHHVLWIDMEQRLWGEFAIMLGINPDMITVVRPTDGEQAMQIVKEALRSEAYGFMVVDSVAALVTVKEQESVIGESKQQAPLSQLMADSCKQVGPMISQCSTTLLWINQLRSKPMVMMGKKEDTAGGRALKFWSSIRIELDKINSISVGQEIVGHEIRARVVKNSCAAPYGKCTYQFRYKGGIDFKGSVIDAAIESGIIVQRSSYFDVPGVEKPIAGRKSLDSLLHTDEAIYNTIAEMVRLSSSDIESPCENETIKEDSCGGLGAIT